LFKLIIFFLLLMLSTLLIKSHLLLVIAYLLSLNSGPNTVLMFPSPRMTTLLNFLLLMSAMHFVLLTLERLTTQLKSHKQNLSSETVRQQLKKVGTFLILFLFQYPV